MWTLKFDCVDFEVKFIIYTHSKKNIGGLFS